MTSRMSRPQRMSFQQEKQQQMSSLVSNGSVEAEWYP